MNTTPPLDTLTDLLEHEPAVGTVLSRVESRVRPQTSVRPNQFASPTELVLVPVLFPVLVYLVRHTLFPWVIEGTRYTELWRLRFRRWIDSQHLEAGVSTQEVKAAATFLSRELEKIDDPAVRTAWERFAGAFRPIADQAASESDQG